MVLTRKAQVESADLVVSADQHAHRGPRADPLPGGSGLQRPPNHSPHQKRAVAALDLDAEPAQPARERRLRAATSFFLRRTLGFS